MSCQGCCLMNLPSPILIDILSRLPLKDIIRGRCICKKWDHFVSDPEFVNLQFPKSPTYFLLNHFDSSPPDSNYFSLVEIQDDPDHRHHLRQFPGIQLQLPKTTPNAHMEIVGLINGFVCIRESSQPHNTLYIWNPILSEFITFQAPESPQSSNGNILTSYGFGLSLKKGEYKVVRISQTWEDDGGPGWEKSECLVLVYTLGTRPGSWRSIQNVKFDGTCSWRHGVFIEGNLHWLNEYVPGGKLYCFDLEKETLEQFPYPPSLYEQYPKATLNLYNGCLCVCDNTEEFNVKVWVMMEYGVANSWTKLFTITEDPIGSLGNHFDSVHFVKVFNDGEILILLGKVIMFFRLPNGGTFDDLYGADFVRNCEPFSEVCDSIFEAVEFVPSFFSSRKLGEHAAPVLRNWVPEAKI